MTYTFDAALDDELVTVIERSDEMGVFQIRVGTLETLVTIRLCRYMTSEHTRFEVSHAIKTPLQIGPYRTSVPSDDSPGSALHRAIDGLTRWYRDAVKMGHEPREDWLVPY